MAVYIDVFGATNPRLENDKAADQFLVADRRAVLQAQQTSLGLTPQSEWIGMSQAKWMVMGYGVGPGSDLRLWTKRLVEQASREFLGLGSETASEIHRAGDHGKTAENLVRMQTRLSQFGQLGNSPDIGLAVTLSCLVGDNLFLSRSGPARILRVRGGQADVLSEGTVIPISADQREPGVVSRQLTVGDSILFLSPGIFESLDDAVILRSTSNESNARVTAEKVVEQAARSACQDVTAIVLKVRETVDEKKAMAAGQPLTADRRADGGAAGQEDRRMQQNPAMTATR